MFCVCIDKRWWSQDKAEYGGFLIEAIHWDFIECGDELVAVGLWGRPDIINDMPETDRRYDCDDL